MPRKTFSRSLAGVQPRGAQFEECQWWASRETRLALRAFAFEHTPPLPRRDDPAQAGAVRAMPASRRAWLGLRTPAVGVLVVLPARSTVAGWQPGGDGERGTGPAEGRLSPCPASRGGLPPPRVCPARAVLQLKMRSIHNRSGKQC